MFPCTDTGRVVNGLIIILNQVSLAILFNVSIKIMLLQYRIFKIYQVKWERFWTREIGPKFNLGTSVLCQDENGDRCSAEIVAIEQIGFDEDCVTPLDWHL